MSWNVSYLPEAKKDFLKLDGSRKILVRKAIEKVTLNPLPSYEGGYGKPLGNKGGRDLSGLLKIKLKAEGLRIVYKLVRREDEMVIVVIGVREDLQVYDEALRRVNKYGL